jgi:hypothetical protein
VCWIKYAAVPALVARPAAQIRTVSPIGIRIMDLATATSHEGR